MNPTRFLIPPWFPTSALAESESHAKKDDLGTSDLALLYPCLAQTPPCSAGHVLTTTISTLGLQTCLQATAQTTSTVLALTAQHRTMLGDAWLVPGEAVETTPESGLH